MGAAFVSDKRTFFYSDNAVGVPVYAGSVCINNVYAELASLLHVHVCVCPLRSCLSAGRNDLS